MVDRRQDRNQEATVWVGGIDTQGSEEIVWELMMQCGPVVDVTMPRDKVTGTHQGYAFVEYQSKEDADYAQRILNMIKLYGKPLRVNKAATDKKEEEESHANVFVGNLDLEVDEKVLFDTFSQFGAVLSAKIMTKEESPESRGFGFVVFDSFEAADAAIESMNGQYLAGRPCHVSYAYKKDGRPGERHGSMAEREIARQRKERMGGSVLRLPVSKEGLQIPQTLGGNRRPTPGGPTGMGFAGGPPPGGPPPPFSSLPNGVPPLPPQRPPQVDQQMQAFEQQMARAPALPPGMPENTQQAPRPMPPPFPPFFGGPPMPPGFGMPMPPMPPPQFGFGGFGGPPMPPMPPQFGRPGMMPPRPPMQFPPRPDFGMGPPVGFPGVPFGDQSSQSQGSSSNPTPPSDMPPRPPSSFPPRPPMPPPSQPPPGLGPGGPPTAPPGPPPPQNFPRPPGQPPPQNFLPGPPPPQNFPPGPPPPQNFPQPPQQPPRPPQPPVAPPPHPPTQPPPS